MGHCHLSVSLLFTDCKYHEPTIFVFALTPDFESLCYGPKSFVCLLIYDFECQCYEPMCVGGHAWRSVNVSGVASFITTDEQIQLNRGCCFLVQAMLPRGFPLHQFNLTYYSCCLVPVWRL